MIKLSNVSVSNGSFSLENLNFESKSGEYIVLTGPTGSGKSTLLESICGIRPIDSGDVVVGNRSVTSLPSQQRNIGYVPQDICLFPTKNVVDQLGFSLVVRKAKDSVCQKRVDQLVELLDLTHLRDRYPDELSGGEKQRVAIGRALAFQPHLLCLDEPLSAIDPELRTQLVDVLKNVHLAELSTVLHVTHRINELAAIPFRHIDMAEITS